jgi:predicted GNAT family N-acyltransferase
MRALELEARARGHDRLVLNAQVAVLPFYERLGYVVDGPEFLEAAIPHRAMSKRLA